MADGIAIGVGDFLASSAKNYFQRHGKLPPNDLAVSNVSVPTGPAAFETLLLAIKQSSATSFLVYAHGHSDGSGLYVQLSARRGAPIGNQTTQNVLDAVLRIANSGKSPTKRELGFLGIQDAEFQTLVGLMHDVQGKQIDLFEFRGCNLGRNPGSMKTFKDFLAPKTFGAPDFYSFFGTSGVGIGKTYVDGNDNYKPNIDGLIWHTYKYSFDNPSGVVLSNIATDGALKPAKGFLTADSRDTVQRFVKTYVDPQDTFRAAETSILLHGMWDTGKRKIEKADLDAPIGKEPPKVIEPNMVLPYGSDDYKNHVIYV